MRFATIGFDTALHWGRLAEATKHRPAGMNDLWIAAIAVESGAEVLTRDTGFLHIPGLRTTIYD